MSRIHLRMLGYVVTLVLHISNIIYMKTFHRGEVMEDPEIRQFIGVQYKFITCWNFLFQIIYALIGLTCDSLTLKKTSNHLSRFLNKTRDTLYSAIIWPSSFQVATLFWPFYLYDLQLVYPVFIDRVVTRLSNHVMHTAIIPIVVWEMVMRPQRKPARETMIVTLLVAYTLAYWAVLFYTYIEQDYWIYPIFEYTYGTIFLPLLICYSTLLLVINYKMQWIVISFLYPTKKLGKKVK